MFSNLILCLKQFFCIHDNEITYGFGIMSCHCNKCKRVKLGEY